jgi:hypothetical protein
MSVHINIRIPDELAARIDERAKAESMSQTAVIVNWLWSASSPTVIQVPPMSPEVVAEFQKAMDAQPQGKITAMGGMRDSPKRLKPVTALVRTPKKVFGPSRLEAILPDLAIAAGVWHGAPPKNLKLARETKPKRGLGRTQKPKDGTVSEQTQGWIDVIKGKPLVTHAPGCKCLMCQGK